MRARVKNGNYKFATIGGQSEGEWHQSILYSNNIGFPFAHRCYSCRGLFLFARGFTMMFSGRAQRALPLMTASVLALMLAACGGGSGVNTPVIISPGIAIGEPVPGALVTTAFVAKARVEQCSDIRNRLFVIDNKMVLSDRAGNCPDNGNAQVLYGSNVETVLCYSADSIAGPVTTCKDEANRALFDTMRKNLDFADLGLGAAHTVKAVDFLPADGSALQFAAVSNAGMSAIQTPKQVVVRDSAAFAALWREHTANLSVAPPLPKVDFATHIVLGLFAGNSQGCHEISMQRVLVSGDKLVAEFIERDINPVAMCIAAQTSPMQLVAVQRTQAAVEFRQVKPLSFSEIVHSSNSYRWAEALRVVIKDQASWATIWAAHATPMTPLGTEPALAAPLPQIDFTRNMVVAVFMGTQGSGCYGTTIDSIYSLGGKLRVSILNTVPGPAMACTMALTSPVHMVQVARSDEPVEFSIQTSNIR
jgi:hypothetical protein